MPDFTLELPHWLYWSGLILFPLVAMYIVRRQKGEVTGARLSLPIAYMFWLSAGFVGIHRFYLKSLWGGIFIPLFVLVLLGNIQIRQALNELSNAKNQISITVFDLERAQTALDEGDQGAEKRKLLAEQALSAAKVGVVEADAKHENWRSLTGGLAALIGVMLLIDGALLPGLKRRREELESEMAEVARSSEEVIAQATSVTLDGGTHEDPTLDVHAPIPDFIDRISTFFGEFVCYWSILAVFVYYYEVISRYVFNSPTNWAHESMFLMFGMQYMLAGAFTYREDSHVRVDVLYLYLPDRIKAVVDIITSIFFFIFAIALLWTGWTFASNAVEVWEVSFTEWAIHYWPVKISIPLGALLLTLQGLSKVMKDVVILKGKEA